MSNDDCLTAPECPIYPNCPEAALKLYVWQPVWHGSKSIFVMAESEPQAIEFANKEMKRLTDQTNDPDYNGGEGYYYDRDFDGWGTDYYKLNILKVGQVVLNDND